jgi:hypothetical protein
VLVSGAARVLVSGAGAGGQEALVGALVAVVEGGPGEVHSASVSSMVMAGHGDAGQVRATLGEGPAHSRGARQTTTRGGHAPGWLTRPGDCFLCLALSSFSCCPTIRPLLFLSGAHLWLSPYLPCPAWFEECPHSVCRACPAFWRTPVPGVRPSW